MAPSRSQIDQYKDEVQELYQSGLTHDELINTINSRHGTSYSVTTLQRRLSSWGLNKGKGSRRMRVKADQRELIQARIAEMMASHTDEQIFEALKSEDLGLSNVRAVQNLRKDLGHHRRHEHNDDKYDEELKAIVRQEIANGSLAKYGRRRYFWEYLRQKGVMVARTRLIRIVQEVDPEGKYRCSRENNKGGKELGSLRNGLHTTHPDPHVPQPYAHATLDAKSPPAPSPTAATHETPVVASLQPVAPPPTQFSWPPSAFPMAPL